MVHYSVVVADASTGTNLAELPFTFSQPFSRVLNGVGTVEGTVPLYHPSATPAILLGDREITVLRDDQPVWNGPITRRKATQSSRVVAITASEPSWYMSKRSLEIDENYNADIFYILRNLFTYFTTKTGASSANINAAIPRFSIAPASGNAGITRAITAYGTARVLWRDFVQKIIDDTSGADFRVDYAPDSSIYPRRLCQRTLTFGAPLGVYRNEHLNEHVLEDFEKDEDIDRAATRVHVTGNGYTYTAQNTGSVTAGTILLESVLDRSDTSNQTVIQNYASDARRKSQPPVDSRTFTFVPGAALPFGFCNLGDHVFADISGNTLLGTSGFRRVVQIAVMPPTDADRRELVTLTTAIPLDELGT